MVARLDSRLIPALILPLVLILGGCPTEQGPYTLSGVVRDSCTGLPVAGATVAFGSHAALTGVGGDYSFTILPEENPLIGTFALYEELEYNFVVVGDVEVDVAASSSIDFWMTPTHPHLYDSVTISGSAHDNTGTELPDLCEITLFIVNGAGGFSYSRSSYDDGSGGYTVETPTFGPGCFVGVLASEGDGTPLFSYYLTNVNLSASGPITLNLVQPAWSAYEAVTINGEAGTTVSANLQIPGTVSPWMGAGSVTMGSASEITAVYNPENYPVVWMTMEYLAGQPEAGFSTIEAHTSPLLAFTGTVTAPAKVSIAGPDAPVLGSSASYVGGTISFTEVDGADSYMMFTEDGSQGAFGYIVTLSSPFTLPAGFVSSVLVPGEDWDARFVPMAGLVSSGFAELLPYLIPSTGGVTMPDVQTVYVTEQEPYTITTADNLIP